MKARKSRASTRRPAGRQRRSGSSRVRARRAVAFMPRRLDPRDVEALHDMRIAAKRLRYVLEVTAPGLRRPTRATAAKRAKELQDLLGEIHDCDVQLPRVEGLIARLRPRTPPRCARAAGGRGRPRSRAGREAPNAAPTAASRALAPTCSARRDAALSRRFLHAGSGERAPYVARLSADGRR